MNLIIVRDEELTAGGRALLTDERARHVRAVLAARPGATVRVGLLDGPLGLGRVLEVADGRVLLACTFEELPPEPPRIDLVLALPRPKVLGRLLAQLAEVGVGRIVLVNAAKVERCYFDSHVLSREFSTARLIEGLQQARDTRLPRLLVRRRFKPFVEDELDAMFPAGLRLAADPSGTRGVGDVFPPRGTGPPQRALLAVGPEGGWVPFELDLLQRRGCTVVALGPRTLRTDTACIALMSLVAERLRDARPDETSDRGK